jgi:hypothetical protein
MSDKTSLFNDDNLSETAESVEKNPPQTWERLANALIHLRVLIFATYCAAMNSIYDKRIDWNRLVWTRASISALLSVFV